MSAERHRPPSLQRPFWRDAQGRRSHVQVVLAEHDAAQRAALLRQHVDAVCEIVQAAATARLEGRQRDARVLATHASRLCGELAGLWPAGSHEPLS